MYAGAVRPGAVRAGVLVPVDGQQRGVVKAGAGFAGAVCVAGGRHAPQERAEEHAETVREGLQALIR